MCTRTSNGDFYDLLREKEEDDDDDDGKKVKFSWYGPEVGEWDDEHLHIDPQAFSCFQFFFFATFENRVVMDGSIVRETISCCCLEEEFSPFFIEKLDFIASTSDDDDDDDDLLHFFSLDRHDMEGKEIRENEVILITNVQQLQDILWWKKMFEK